MALKGTVRCMQYCIIRWLLNTLQNQNKTELLNFFEMAIPVFHSQVVRSAITYTACMVCNITMICDSWIWMQDTRWDLGWLMVKCWKDCGHFYVVFLRWPKKCKQHIEWMFWQMHCYTIHSWHLKTWVRPYMFPHTECLH